MCRANLWLRRQKGRGLAQSFIQELKETNDIGTVQTHPKATGVCDGAGSQFGRQAHAIKKFVEKVATIEQHKGGGQE